MQRRLSELGRARHRCPVEVVHCDGILVFYDDASYLLCFASPVMPVPTDADPSITPAPPLALPALEHFKVTNLPPAAY